MSKKKKYEDTITFTTSTSYPSYTIGDPVFYSSGDDYIHYDSKTSSKTKIPYPIFRDYVLDCIKIKDIFTLRKTYLFWFTCENVSDTINVSKDKDIDDAGNVAKNLFVDKLFHDDDKYQKLLGTKYDLTSDDSFTVSWSGGLYPNSTSISPSTVTGAVPSSSWGTTATPNYAHMSQSFPTSMPPKNSSAKVTVTNQTTNQPFFSVDRSNQTLKTDYQFKNCNLSLTEHGDLTINYAKSESITLNLNGASKTIRDHEGNIITSQKKLTSILNKLLS